MLVSKYLNLTLLLYFFALTGLFVTSKHIIIILIAIEILFLSINLNYIGMSVYIGDCFGKIFPLFIVTVAASETALGLSILIVYFRGRASISLDLLSLLKC